MKVLEYDIWDGDRTDEILRIIDADLTEKIDALKDTVSVDYAAPEECTNKFETKFFELLVFTVRNVLRDGYFGQNQSAIIGNALQRFYATNIVETTGVKFDIQSVEHRTLTNIRWKKNSDPEFKDITDLYLLLEQGSEELARINKVLVFSGVRPDFFYGQMPMQNKFKLTTEELISDAVTKFESRMREVYLFESESHHVEIDERVFPYLLDQLRIPKAAGFTFKRPASHVSFGTSSEAPGSPKSVAKKKDGSDNTFLIIALLLVAVGIVVFFV